MGNLKVVTVWLMINSVVTVLTSTTSTWVTEQHLQVEEFEPNLPPAHVGKSDVNPYHDEPTRARSRSNHRTRGKAPGFPGGPGSAVLPTVSGRVFCASCNSVNTPLFGTKATLLCPHPPPAGGGGRPPVHEVSTAVTDEDGSFHFTVNASYTHIMHRCAVTVSKTSDTNCDLPPPTGSSISVSVASTLSKSASASDSTILHYNMGPFSFHPASCSRKSRTLLQAGEDPLSMDQIPEKNHNHKGPRNPVPGSGGHNGPEVPHPREQTRKKSKSLKQFANKLPPLLEESKAVHVRSSVPRALIRVIPPSPQTYAEHRHPKYGPPHV